MGDSVQGRRKEQGDGVVSNGGRNVYAWRGKGLEIGEV